MSDLLITKSAYFVYTVNVVYSKMDEGLLVGLFGGPWQFGGVKALPPGPLPLLNPPLEGAICG